MGDLRAVLSVGANTLWASTVPNAANGNQRTIAAIPEGERVGLDHPRRNRAEHRK